MHILQTILTLFLLSWPVCIVAFVYSYVLTMPGMLLGRLSGLLEDSLPEWLFMPLIGCFRCVAGQAALWSYFFISPFHYSIFYHIFFISVCIYNVHFIKFLYLKVSNE